MAQIDITRTELVWPGKYDEYGQRVLPPRVTLPFQTIETINETRATREAKKKPEQFSLFDVWTGDEGETFEDGWRNKLIWGDNLLVMSSLLEKFAGKIDLIYIDPPFATGTDFSIVAPIGDGDEEASKEQSVVEEKAYRDTWARGYDSWLDMMAGRLTLARELLSQTGSLFVHVDWRVQHLLRCLLDEIMGIGQFNNEIIWHYDQGARPKTLFGRKHDNIYWYGKSEEHVFNSSEVLVPFESGMTEWRYTKGGQAGKEMPAGKVPSDVWDIKLNAMSHEHLGYPTQKPEELLERIIKAVTEPGQLVADFFVGSGTAAAVAEKLGRRWIACDLGRFSVHTARKRLMGIENCKPFEVLNLGKYERQFWQVSAFGGPDRERAVFEYIAFMLRLYGAVPLPGMQHLHGKRSGAVVHIGSVDAPVTFDEVVNSLDEAAATGQAELHVLGWEWEMGLNDTVSQLAHERRLRLKLLAIPREVMEAQAVERGDIRFFELAHLECGLEVRAASGVVVKLTDFAMSDVEALDDEIPCLSG